MLASVSVSKPLLALGGALVLMAAAPPPPAPAPAPEPSWAGTWRGTLTNEPARANAPKVDVMREIGPWPQKDGDCTTWRTIYSIAGVEKSRKDYRLCPAQRPR